MGHIYKITNTVNGKVYIGKTTVGVEKRWRKHQTEAQRDRGYKSALYDAMNKYGADKFTIEAIETCSNDALDKRERLWIKHFNSYGMDQLRALYSLCSNHSLRQTFLDNKFSPLFNCTTVLGGTDSEDFKHWLFP